MKFIKKYFAIILIGILTITQITNIKAYDFGPVTYNIKMYGTIYNKKGQVVQENAVFERDYTFDEDTDTYIYGGGEEADPTYFKLNKNQTIILDYVEVNGVRAEVELHPSNLLKANLISDDLYFAYSPSETSALDNAFSIMLFRKTPIVVTAKNMTVTFNGLQQELSGFTVNETKLRPGHRVVVDNETLSATEAGEYTLDLGSAKVYDENDNDVSYLYSLYLEPGTLTIQPAPVTLTINNVEKTIGSDDPLLSAQVEGTIKGYPLDYTLEREAGETVGDYSITAQYTENKNYIVQVIDGQFSILAAIIDQPNDEETILPNPENPTTPDFNGTTDVPENEIIETPEIGITEVPENETTVIPEAEITVNQNIAPVTPAIIPTVVTPIVETTPVVNTPVQNTVQTVEENNDDTEEVVEINDNETPLAKGQNSWALVNLMASIVTVFLGIVIILLKKNKESQDEENITYKKRYIWMKVLGTLIALLSVIVFILTEDLTLPMAMLDKYTVIMIAIALIQCVVLFTHTIIKKKVDEDMSQA